MATRPPPLSKREEKHRRDILELIEKGWVAGEWANHIPKIVHDILLRNLFETKISHSTWTNRAADGIQWINLEEIRKSLIDKTRAVRISNVKKRRIQTLAMARHRASRVNSSNLNVNWKHPLDVDSRNSED